MTDQEFVKQKTFDSLVPFCINKKQAEIETNKIMKFYQDWANYRNISFKEAVRFHNRYIFEEDAEERKNILNRLGLNSTGQKANK